MTGRADPLAVMAEAPELLLLATTEPFSDQLKGCAPRMRQAHVDVSALVEAARAARDRSAGRLFDTDQETGETFHEQLSAALAPFGESP